MHPPAFRSVDDPEPGALLTHPLTYDQHGIELRDLDEDAVYVIERLREHGYAAFLVGGCVRDIVRSRKRPKDFDVITEATPRQIRRVFRNSRQIGRRFKIIHVFWDQKVVEVTTFRAPADGAADPRSGDGEPVFGDARSDALLRDFTINALLYDPAGDVVLDYVGGYADLQAGILRTIGDAQRRIGEDPVRILRGIRYAAGSRLALDPATRAAFIEHRRRVAEINASRLREEVLKFLKARATADAFELALDLGVFQLLLPGLERWIEPDGNLLADLEEKDALPAERLETPLLWAILFLGALDEAGCSEPGREVEHLPKSAIELMESLGVRHNIARRDRLIARALLETVPRLLRGPTPRNVRLANRPYFPQALDLYELYCRVRDLPLGALRAWQDARVAAVRARALEPAPELETGRPRRRRGRGGRGRSRSLS